MISHGTLTIEGKQFRLDTEPHVRMVVKRLLIGCDVKGNTIRIKRTPSTTEDMKMILGRWHHDVSPALRDLIEARVESNIADREQARLIMSGEAKPTEPARWNPAMPLRDYQLQPVALSRIMRGLLIGDDLGLGKTAEGIAIIADNPGKALVVCQRHLQEQWRDQIQLFCPGLKTHIIKWKKEYILPEHDVTICSYTKIAEWAFRRDWETVVYDEVQELRHSTTVKYQGAKHLATECSTRIGLSATPVYNYAGEIYNVMEILSPGTCGSLEEFKWEWTADDKFRVADPEALGDWLRNQNIYIRRRRADVGRELPKVHRMNHMVEHNPKVIARMAAQFNELAQKVLTAGFHQAGLASRELDIKMRHVTGLAKAPFVADFVETLALNGEKVLLAGWHRDVYEVWRREFQRMGIKAAFFTGTESPAQKAAAVKGFTQGDTQVLIMSLRSGAGLDGLQTAARTVVIGELDWSPQVIEQLIGRLNRDGQASQVTVFTLVSDAGADPIMATVLGAKWESSTGLTDPHLLKQKHDSGLGTPGPVNRVAELASHWLNQKKHED